MSGKQVPPKWRRIPGLLMKYEKYAPACAFPGQQWQCGQRSYFHPDSFHQSETSSPPPPRSEGLREGFLENVEPSFHSAGPRGIPRQHLFSALCAVEEDVARNSSSTSSVGGTHYKSVTPPSPPTPLFSQTHRYNKRQPVKL